MKSTFLVIGILVCLIAAVPAVNAQIGGGEGWITIRCNVDGASVYFDGQYQGMISANQLTVSVYTTATPYRTYSVEKSGYYPASGDIVMPEAGQTRTYTATLQLMPTPTPAPEYGSIRVESSPSGAAIYLNGNYRGVAPLTISDVRAGSYSIEADLSGYRTYTTTTTVYAGSRSDVYCPMTQIVSSGALYITSDPSNALVYLDGTYKGRTPLTLNNLATGEHIVELDLSGYYDWKSTVSVPSGGTRTVSATMNPIPVSNTGWIYVSSSPGGATVFLDGGNAGQTPNSGALKLNGIQAGDHTIKLQMTGYNDYSTTVNVRQSTVSDVSTVLVPVGVSPSTGGFTVSSTPSGASVYVDNVLRGITPLTMTDIPAGSHTLLIQQSGYQDYVSTVQVNSGATNTVVATLNHVATPTQKSGALPVAAGMALVIIGLFVVCRRD